MLAEYKNKTNIGVGLGLVLSIGARILMQKGPEILPVGILLGVVGSALFIWGCCCYSMGKGHHWAFGFFGLLSIIGLIILICFPDKYRESGGRIVQVPLPPSAPPPADEPTPPSSTP